MGERLIGYARDSGGREQQLSVDQQLERMGVWCQEHGHVLTRTFVDRARSGTSTTGRDQFRDMMDYLTNGAAESGLVLWEFSRLARDYDDAQFFIADLRRRGIEVYSITDNIPPGLDGRLLESIMNWKNARYSEELARNVMRGQRFYVQHHRGHSGKPPTGYLGERVEVGKHRDGSPHLVTQLVIDPVRAPLVKMAFEMRAGGATLGEIHAATRLHEWNVVYSKMLINSIYKGTYRFGGEDYPGFCEAIVDEETWERAQAVNRERAERHGYNHPRAVRSRFMLTGLLICAVCGRSMNGRMTIQRKPWNDKRYDYYRCSSSNAEYCRAAQIPKEELEERVLQVVTDVVLTPAVLGELQAEVERQAAQVGDVQRVRRERLEREYAETSGRITRLVAAIRDAGHSRALIDELAGLERRLGEIGMEMGSVEVAVVKMPANLPDNFMETAARALLEAGDIEKGVILRGFVRRIIVRKVMKSKREGKIEGEIIVGVGELEKSVSL